jgi:hypothetical protein
MCSSASNVNPAFRPAHRNQPNNQSHTKRKPLPAENNNGNRDINCRWMEGGIATPFNCNVNGDPWGTPSEK